MMKIATWNIERLKHKSNLNEILSICERVNADIFILTETDKQVLLNYRYCYKTALLMEIQPKIYENTENRVSIYTDYRCIRQYPTYDKYTAICVELETEKGSLIVYGTIIGNFGNRHHSFQQDLEKQMKDFQALSRLGKPLCICGDYNLSFADNYYFTKIGRKSVIDCFAHNGIKLITENCHECIDHIAISESCANKSCVDIEEWNLDKRLSDHKGIAVNFSAEAD